MAHFKRTRGHREFKTRSAVVKDVCPDVCALCIKCTCIKYCADDSGCARSHIIGDLWANGRLPEKMEFLLINLKTNNMIKTRGIGTYSTEQAFYWVW